MLLGRLVPWQSRHKAVNQCYVSKEKFSFQRFHEEVTACHVKRRRERQAVTKDLTSSSKFSGFYVTGTSFTAYKWLIVKA